MILNEFFNLPQVFEKQTDEGIFGSRPSPVLPVVDKIAKVAGGLTPQNVEVGKQIIQNKASEITRMLSPQARVGVDVIEQGVAEGLTGLSIQQLATISDEALDNAYHYGRSQPGNTFGWQANLKSAAYAKQMIDKGVTDIEAISDAIHKGWNVTAQAFVKNPDQFSDTEKLKAAGKLEAKLQQRAQLMKQNYAQLPEEEKEKDRVVARALLQAIKGEQGVAEGKDDYVPPREANYDDKYQAMVRRVGEKARAQEKAKQQPPKTPVRESRLALLKQIIQS